MIALSMQIWTLQDSLVSWKYDLNVRQPSFLLPPGLGGWLTEEGLTTGFSQLTTAQAKELSAYCFQM